MIRYNCGKIPASISCLLVRFIVLFHLIWRISAQVDWCESQYNSTIYSVPGTYIKFTFVEGVLVQWVAYFQAIIFCIILILRFYLTMFEFRGLTKLLLIRDIFILWLRCFFMWISYISGISGKHGKMHA